MKIFTIIVTYNALTQDWLYKCLDSLMSSALSTEIICVDNGSTDATCQIIKSKYPSVILIENKENKGFGAANNQGFEYGIRNNADYFFLLNQDAWIETDTLEKLVQQYKNNPEYGIISPLHLNGVGDALDYNFSNYITPTNCPKLYSDFVLGIPEDKIYPTNFVNAAAWLLPIKSLKVVGGFSPAFFHYGEDNNYCQRIIFHKFKIGVFPFAKIFHDREGSRENVSNVYLSDKLRKLKYSNPFVDYDLASELRYLKRKIIKDKIMLRKNVMKTNREQLKFLINEAPTLESYKNESKKTNSFSFLNI